LATAMLIENGLDEGPAGKLAMALLDKAVISQSTVIAFDTAFNAVALIFVFAAPMLIAFKFCLHRLGHRVSSHSQPASDRRTVRMPEMALSAQEHMPRAPSILSEAM